MMFFIPMTSAIYEDCSIYGTCEPVANIKDYFTQLVDTPSTYTGAGGQCVKVDSGESGLEFGSCGSGGGGLEASGVYLYNDSTTLYFNDTYAGENLAVNSSDYWDGLNSFNTTQMENNGGILSILSSWITSFSLSDFINDLGLSDFTDDVTNLNSFYNKTETNDIFETHNNSAIELVCSRQTINNDGFLHMGNVLTGQRRGYVALCNGSITGLSLTTQVGTVAVGSGPDWSFNFTARIGNVDQTGFEVANLSTGENVLNWTRLTEGDYPFTEGQIIQCYSDEKAGTGASASLTKTHFVIEAKYTGC